MRDAGTVELVYELEYGALTLLSNCLSMKLRSAVL